MTNKVHSLKPSCCWCGISHKDATAMLGVGDKTICGACIAHAWDHIKDEIPTAVAIDGNKTPSKIVEFVNQYVIGQNEAKRTLALAIYNHYKRINNPLFGDVEIQKSNILLIGPSGTGKTLLLKSIARFLDVPFAVADATALSATGYVGEDVSSILNTLVQNADGNIEKAARGIIYLDEVDKIAKKSSGPSNDKDPGGECVQQELLKIIEGTKANISKMGGRKISGTQMDTIDTTNILFICGGAFVGLDDIVKRDHYKSSMGIGFASSVKEDGAEYDYRNDLEPEDLYQFGMIPELIGRLPVICTLKDLTVDDLVRVLTEPKDSIIKQFQALAKMDGAGLTFSDDALHKIAEEAVLQKTGARGLRSIVEKVLNDIMFELPDKKYKLIEVDVVDSEFNVTAREQ